MKKLLSKIIGKFFFYLLDIAQQNAYSTYRSKYDIHPTFIFNGNNILMYGEGNIIINENSYIGRFSILQAAENSNIKIGKNCKIGPCFNIWTQSSIVDADYNNEAEILPKIGDIIIGDAVWIGANVVISPGVIIGNNSIIGANSVVSKDVPAFAIVGGVPAKLLRFKTII